jgi:hypothetical protein
MQLTFETVAVIGNGSHPDFVQFEKTDGELFYLNGGKMYGTPSERLEGIFSNPVWLDSHDVSPDNETGINRLELKTLSGFGIVGTYTTPTAQKLIIYEFQHDISSYLSHGSINYNIADPITKFSLKLENPDILDPERPGTVIINEENSLISPGAKIIFKFGMGAEEEDYDLGTFYVDRSNFDLLSKTASVDGRNKIGKVLRDQTFDEKNEFWMQSLTETIKDIFYNAKLTNDEYIVQNTSQQSWFSFDRDSNLYQGIEKIFETIPEWKIREREDGTIVVGADTFNGFDQKGTYIFHRNKDIFSRQVTRDDEEVYRRVCVHTAEFALFVYKEVTDFQGWNLQTNKTLYVEVAEGSTMVDIDNYATELVKRVSNVGKIESFDGPFRPFLQIGDAATIVAPNGSSNLGLITEVAHEFGISGFQTSFTVDSGGSLNTGRVSDYIRKLTGAAKAGAKIGKSNVDTDEYFNIARSSRVTTSSIRSTLWDKDRLNDGKKYFLLPSDHDGSGWQPSDDDLYPFINIDFGKQCKLDKIKLYLDFDKTEPEAMPAYYRIEYWDSRNWITLLTQSGGITFEMEHTFTAVNTSAVRFILQRKVGGRQNWREIELWGNV